MYGFTTVLLSLFYVLAKIITVVKDATFPALYSLSLFRIHCPAFAYGEELQAAFLGNFLALTMSPIPAYTCNVTVALWTLREKRLQTTKIIASTLIANQETAQV